MENKSIVNSEREAEEIQINPSVLQQKGKTYSSLTDINGVPLFTNKYEETIVFVQGEKAAESRNLQALIFTGNTEKRDEDDKVQDRLFMSTGTQVKKKEVTVEKTNIGQTMAIVGIVLIIFFMIVFSIFEKRIQRRREHAADNYTYE